METISLEGTINRKFLIRVSDSSCALYSPYTEEQHTDRYGQAADEGIPELACSERTRPKVIGEEDSKAL